MSSVAGRPRASSREVLAEAACELFLERGYDATSIVDITTRAGVSRSSFFNYFSSKGDLVWSAFDERILELARGLERDGDGGEPDRNERVHNAVRSMVEDFAPDSLALALANSSAMGLVEELERESAVRRARIARTVAAALQGAGENTLRAAVRGAAYGGAVMAALEQWADGGQGRTPLAQTLERALSELGGLAEGPGGAVRQLRLVVKADDFESAVRFYRDALGMPQAEAYEADGGARVVILDAGRATLEIANAAQVRFIDAVETDGGSSDRLRVALEVADTVAVAERLSAAGAVVEACARQTPWRSINARLRGAADVQLTVFQELGPEQAGDRSD